MSSLDPAAPQLMEMRYLRHRPGIHTSTLNHQFVPVATHEWIAPGEELPRMCREVTSEIRPNIPLDTQIAMQHIMRASDVDHNVFPGAHQLYDSDPIGFLLISPLWVREIIDSVGEAEATR